MELDTTRILELLDQAIFGKESEIRVLNEWRNKHAPMEEYAEIAIEMERLKGEFAGITYAKSLINEAIKQKEEDA